MGNKAPSDKEPCICMTASRQIGKKKIQVVKREKKGDITADRKAHMFPPRTHCEAGWCWGWGWGWMIRLRANRCATNVLHVKLPRHGLNQTALHRSGLRKQRRWFE